MKLKSPPCLSLDKDQTHQQMTSPCKRREKNYLIHEVSTKVSKLPSNMTIVRKIIWELTQTTMTTATRTSLNKWF